MLLMQPILRELAAPIPGCGLNMTPNSRHNCARPMKGHSAYFGVQVDPKCVRPRNTFRVDSFLSKTVQMPKESHGYFRSTWSPKLQKVSVSKERMCDLYVAGC